mgnify:FL=1
MGDQDERVGVDRGRAPCGPCVPSARVHDQGRVEGTARRDHAGIVGGAAASGVTDEGTHSPDDGQVIEQRRQVGVLGGVQIRPPHAGNVVVTRERDTGYGPGRVNDDRVSHPRSAGTAQPAPPTPSGAPTTPTLAGQQPNDASHPNPSGDPSDRPYRARAASSRTGLGDEGHEERGVPRQPHLTALPDAHAGHSLGHGSRR